MNIEVQAEESGSLRTYRAPWKGELVLVCRKCQKRVKGRKHGSVLSKVSRWFKQRAKREGAGTELRVLQIPCVKLCPKGGVTLFSRQQLATDPPGVSIARSENDLERFYASLRRAKDTTL